MSDPFILLQHTLPKRAISTAVGWLTRLRAGIFTQLAIRSFVRAYKVNMTDAAISELSHYHTFNEFFTRELKPGARPQPADTNDISSPADGTLSEFGEISGEHIIQAKGLRYTLADFLGDAEIAKHFEGGSFLTVYLAPYNYHRVHMPTTGSPRVMRYLGNELFAVNTRTARNLPRLFCRNERAAVVFDCDGGALALVMVGALNVGSIELTMPQSQPFLNRPGLTHMPDISYALNAENTSKRGDEFGRFNMGSTVVMLATPGLLQWSQSLSVGQALQVGQSLGTLNLQD